VLRPFTSTTPGVCDVSEETRFVSTDAKIDWYAKPTVDDSNYGSYFRMALVDGPCPPVDDDRYIGAEHVSEGMFRTILKTWQGISATEQTFDAAFRGLDASALRSALFGEKASKADIHPAAVTLTLTKDETLISNPKSGYQL